jgi:ABC-type multidrug transport system fused ATPase/permease subunit
VKLIDYLFYKIYSILLKIPFADDTTEFGAFSVVSILLLFNIMSIIGVLQILTGYTIIPILRVELKVIFFLIYLIPLYFMFIYKQKYKRIFEKYESLPNERKKKFNKWVYIYIIGTVFIFFLLNIIKLSIWGRP